ncbi:MAG: 16S rRNA (cytosine(967)-C(5))-methyltransferase RsmB [Actinomycetota bacterium]
MNENNSRLVAYHIIRQYLDTKKPLKQIIYRHLDASISRIDRNFIYNMAKGTIRYLMFFDYGISLFSNKNIGKIDPEVLAILRLAAYQLMFMAKVPSYSIVDQAVEMTKKLVNPGAAKFVNALLRKMSQKDELKNYVFNKILTSGYRQEKRISLAYSYPQWLVTYWAGFYGIKETEKLCDSLNRNPCLFLRINSGKVDRGQVLRILGINEDQKEMCTDLPESLSKINFRLSSLGEVGNSSLIKEGLAGIQDLSSQIAVRYFLDPGPGDSILDVCAAPGGKTMFAYELMKGEGSITSVDISIGKAKKMEKNLKKYGAGNVKIVVDDATRLDKLNKGMLFDKILIDAPCSALGTISKNPDVKYNKRKEDMGRLASNSLKILDSSVRFLKPGGEITYYTCTLSPVENQQVIEKFIKENPAYSVCNNISGELKNIAASKYMEIKPYYFGSEGGFACTLRKAGKP